MEPCTNVKQRQQEQVILSTTAREPVTHRPRRGEPTDLLDKLVADEVRHHDVTATRPATVRAADTLTGVEVIELFRTPRNMNGTKNGDALVTANQRVPQPRRVRFRIGADQVSPGPIRASDKNLKMIRMKLIVVVEECHPRGSYFRESGVPGDMRPSTVMVDMDDDVGGWYGLPVYRPDSPLQPCCAFWQ